MKSAGKARNNGLCRHIRTSKEIIRNLLNDLLNTSTYQTSMQAYSIFSVSGWIVSIGLPSSRA